MKRKVLFCEGAEDQALVEAMVLSGVLADDMEVRHIGELLGKTAPSTGKGVTGLKAYLKAFVPYLKGKNFIGILADNDREPPLSNVETYVQNELRDLHAHADTRGLYSYPTAAHARATNGKIATTLVLLPGGTSKGCLETLLTRVLNAEYPAEMKCVETMLKCANATTANGWTSSKIDKARVRAAIAALNKQKPQTPLYNLWANYPNLIPPAHELFRPLASALSAI